MLENKITGSLFYRVFNYKYFFRIILFIFIFEALWIALSSAYPMGFDEDFHLGIIRLFASHISPFWAHQPRNADVFGAIARDPSYLYQYLMSFIYRLITLFTSNQSVIVIILRFINIGLVAWGLVLFRKLLLKTKASISKINFSLLIFILLPVFPLLAAQINYDNLFFPLTALTFILTINLADKIFAKKFDTLLLFQIIILCILTSLVKYAFLPIALIVFLYLIFEINKNIKIKNCISLIKNDLQKLSYLKKAYLLIILILSIGLFSQRYAVNLVKYHTVIPDCSRVLSIKECSVYGPWIRDYNFKINKIDTEIGTEKNLITYSADWFYGMWLRTYFSVSGPALNYQSRGPMPIPSISGIFFACLGLIATIFTFKKILNKYNSHHILFLLLACFFYVAVLWLDEFKAFRETGQPVAINGRYVFPVILPLILILVIGTSIALAKYQKLKMFLAVVCLLCLIWGGGLLTFILRSNDVWYFNSRLVRNINHAVQRTIGPISPGFSTPGEFL
ncbi:MAG TPA: hypothetical protein VLF63_00510 [Patescibacteria group bacterium]|nr:hypothetical protein [Patescibacteria group bacterium]